jgi:serine/threonine protein kinase
MSATFAREEALFSAMSALPPAERAAYLERACGANLRLRQRVESLLADTDAAASFMDAVTGNAGDAHFEMLTDDVAGEPEVLGAYRLLRLLGEGGSSLVYLAEQIAPVQREVAVKVIKLGMDTRAVLARFQAERQAVALMDHPNIAKVFDAGAAPTGRPYFVMERVHGIKITEYCDQLRLTTSERVGLFVQVCHAIHHAHQRGVIHRDIKPANILVTLHDGVAVAKVIDFGIAKALRGRLAEATACTAAAQFIGTPAYVSPEQTDPLGAEIDERSDIYSLGVLLYELLTGCTPFENAELIESGLDEMRARIRDEEPPTPSRRLSSLRDDVATSTASRRNSSRAALIERVHGDLDWIVMRCLEKDAARRYASARELALDLERFLRHEPVLARPPSAAYVLAKFARRHQMLCVTVSAIMSVLVLATAVSLWLAIKASDAEHRARAASAAAQLASDEGAEVLGFLQNDLLAQAAPGSGADPDVKLRAVVDRAAQGVERRFADRPLVAASIHETLGSTYESLAQFTASRQHYEAALKIRKAELGERDERTLRVMNGLIFALDADGQTAAAKELAIETLALARAALGPEHPVTLIAMLRLSGTYESEGNYKEAEALDLAALDIRRRVFGPEHPETLSLMGSLGTIYGKEGRYAESEAMRSEALAGQRRVLGPEHVETLIATNDLVVTYQMQRKNTQARELLTDLLPKMRRVFGPEHPYTAVAITNLASLTTSEGRFAEAEPLGRESVELLRRVNGPEHPHTIIAMNNLSLTYRLEGKLDAAMQLQAQAFAIGTRVLGNEHFTMLALRVNMARTLADAGRLADADAAFASILGTQKRVLGPTHPETLEAARDYGSLLLARHKYAAAETQLRYVIESREKLPTPGWQIDAARSALGEALARRQSYVAAEPLLVDGYERLDEFRRKRVGPVTPQMAREIAASGTRVTALYDAWGKPDNAAAWRERVAARGPLPADHARGTAAVQ